MHKPVFFTLCSEKDLKKTVVSAGVERFNVVSIWLGSCEGLTFTSEGQKLADPARKPWFVLHIDWVEPDDGKGRYWRLEHGEKIATNGEEYTYIKQSLPTPRIPFTEKVKSVVNAKIAKFWRKV